MKKFSLTFRSFCANPPSLNLVYLEYGSVSVGAGHYHKV